VHIDQWMVQWYNSAHRQSPLSRIKHWDKNTDKNNMVYLITYSHKQQQQNN